MTGCLAPRHDEPEPAEPGARLCRPCLSGLGRDLRRLPALYAELESILDVADLPDPYCSADANGSVTSGLPFNDAVSECRSQITRDLTWWARQVADLRGSWPPGISVPELAGWLHPQARWASFRGWAGDMAGALAADRGRADALLNPRPALRPVIPAALNRCPRCGVAGGLAAVVYTGPGDPRPSLVTCSGCGHEWDATQWLKLGRDILRISEAKAA